MKVSPVIILVKPQMAENIGAAARAMANFGLTELRLVAPRPRWPSETARRMSSGAEEILDNAKVYKTTKDAVADLNVLYATTARPRDMVKAVLSPSHAVAEVRSSLGVGHNVGILFGPERTGLENDDIVMSDRMIAIPTEEKFNSLNLAQAVCVMAYEWKKSEGAHKDFEEDFGNSVPANKEETNGFFEHLETELAASNFFKSAEKRPGMMANIRNALSRARFTDQDIRTLRGIVRALVHKY